MSKPLLKKQDVGERKERLLLFDEIPAWQKPTAGSWKKCLESMLGWHNETINIHSHTFGAALFAILPLHFYYTLYQNVRDAQPMDVVVFLLYFLGVAICFACSAGCHVVWNHSPPIASLGNRLDFSGIVILMWGASLASIHFAFICDPWLRTVHWGLVSASAAGCLAFTLCPVFIKPAFRAARAGMYASFGLFAVVFVMHGFYLYGFAVQRRRLALEWMALMALLNLLGAAFYALRFPEAWFPYTFDFLGASHQIFHVLVLAAGLVHYKGLANAFVEVRGLQHTCQGVTLS
ncbi:mPR-typeG-protein-coupled receptor, partial [Aureobasidium melanogenum]|uniref:MPR-typeG-protein-coupled receptor n=1 Tax=Aureobasidium melanogenum (strain CBS 110374) TaxID=1043003 RepID=A0A074VFC2_AURM1